MKPRLVLFLFLLALILSVPASLPAKFGVVKTRVTFLLRHAPAFSAPGRELSLEVISADPRSGPLVSTQLLQALEQSLVREDYRVNASARTAVRLTVTEAAASVEKHAWLEPVNVLLGVHAEKDDKGKDKQVEDCKTQQAEVIYLVSYGGLYATLSATDQKAQALLFSQPIQKRYWDRSAVSGPNRCGGQAYSPRQEQIQDPGAILAWLSQQAAAATIPLLVGFDETREVLLAVDDELKRGNALAETGRWQLALEAWQAAPIREGKPAKEAARQYNVGVAHEIMAASAIRSRDLRQARLHLDKATEAYNRAVSLDPEEKYFRDTDDRLRHELGVLQKFEEYESSGK